MFFGSSVCFVIHLWVASLDSVNNWLCNCFRLMY